MTTWVEVDSATTDPVETDIVFGPITTATSMQGRVITNLDNLATQNPHYALIPSYVNEASVEILTLGLSMNRQVLDQLPRLRNWRWYGQTVVGQDWLPLPERMLYMEGMAYTKLTTAYDPSTQILYPSVMQPAGAAQDFGLMSRTETGWPTRCRRAGSRVEILPVPSVSPTDYRTTVVLYGTRMDSILSASTDTLLMSPRMQLLVVDLATVIAMEKMGWDEASDKRVAFESRLGRLISGGAKERVATGARTRVAGTPR